ncbi:MAG: hypothetical protein WCH85_00760 [Methanomicrobiales archaeon]
MTHITELSIHNFRAIRELTYTPKQINILTGRNNTGKTALLDPKFATKRIKVFLV